MENKKSDKQASFIVAIVMLSVCLLLIGFVAIMATKTYYEIQYEKALTKKVKKETEVLELQKKVYELEYRKEFYNQQ